MKSQLVPLYELGEIVSGSTPDTTNMEFWGGSIPWITPADLTGHQGIFFTGDLRKITELGYKSCSTKIIPPGSILFSSRAPIGHCAVTTFPLCTNQGFKTLIPNKKLNPIYGYFALKHFTPQIESLGRGATFTEVNKELFENICIPLPPLPEQQRIAAILQKADRLRRLRRYARELSDGYLQSVFLEMFGASLLGEADTPLVSLESVCTKITDGTHITPKYIESGIPFISIKDLTKHPGQIDFSDVRHISLEEHMKLSKLTNVEKGDVLYTKVGTYGIAQLVTTDKKFSIFVSISLLKPDTNQILPKFLETVLNTDFVKKQADRLVSGIGVPDLHLREIKTISIPLPNMSMQNRFVEIAHQNEYLRMQQGEAERQSEHLFQSLLQRAFQGEL